MVELHISDDLYPQFLKSISSPPSLLYLEGNLNLLKSKSIAIIGTRNCSKNGQKLTAKFAYELSMSGITIISGLAKGIDSIAHLYSYKNSGKTIAILGCGFNNIFPKENIQLYQDILKNDGLIISEYPPCTQAKSEYFLKRNRLISALSLGVLVIEATYRSGTSVTSKYAIQQGKKLFTIPHEIWDSKGIGTNKLLKNGAKLVTDSSDIFNELNLNEYYSEYQKLKKEGLFHNLSNFDKIENINSSISLSSPIFSDTKQDEIYHIIQNSQIPLYVNDLVYKTHYPIKEILSILFILEIDGFIKKTNGGYICQKNNL